MNNILPFVTVTTKNNNNSQLIYKTKISIFMQIFTKLKQK